MSVSKSSYTKFPITYKEDTKERCNYLRASHFAFGTDKSVQALPESKYAYTQKEFVPTMTDPTLAKDIRGTHIGYMFDPKHDGNVQSLGKSTYQEKVSETIKGNKLKPNYEYKDLHVTSFILGSDKPSFSSEAKTKYVIQESQKQKYDLTTSRETMKKSSFEVAHVISPLDPKFHYTSETKDQFIGKKTDAKMLNAAKEFSKDLRKAHFAFGSQSGPLITYKQLYHGAGIKEFAPAKLNVDQLNDLKKTHFEMGSCRDEKTTYYKDKYPWIQPVSKQSAQS